MRIKFFFEEKTNLAKNYIMPKKEYINQLFIIKVDGYHFFL